METKAVHLVRCPRCRKVLPEPQDVQVYKCGGCGVVLQVKKRKTDTVDARSPRFEEDSTGKQKMEQLSNDQEAGSSSSHLINEDRKCDHNDLPSSTEDQDLAEKVKMEQVSDDQEPRYNSVNESDQNCYYNGHRSSTELSGHGDPESSPESAAHNRMDQEQDLHRQGAAMNEENVTVVMKSGGIKQLSDDPEADCSMNQESLVKSIDELSSHEDSKPSPESTVHHDHDHDQDQEQRVFMINGDFENDINESEDEDSSREMFATPEKYSFSELSEIEEQSRGTIAHTTIVRDSDGGSKTSFKSFITDKLLDTRPRKTVYLDEDDELSEDGSADLRHRQRLKHTSSVETLENAQLGGTKKYYGYDGSISSFDEDDSRVAGKNHMGLKGFRNVDHRFKRHNVRSIDDGPSRLGFNELGRRPPVIPGNAKLERLELLKMVQELQEQLARTNVSKAPQQISSYYDSGFNHPGRYGQRLAFSGETMAVGSSCRHSCAQDRHFSAQLPRHHLPPLYVSRTCCSSHCSNPSSPPHQSEAEFFTPVHSKPEPAEFRHRNDIPKPHRSPKKRYVRPIAGGSPWITCYRCSEILQLPQSFLVFKKKCHNLQCGACLKVLSFTLSNGTHVHRYYPEETIAAPPSSEVEDNGHTSISQAGPVSCSDRSFQKSYSTETDRYGSLEFSEERRKATMLRDPSTSTRPPSAKSSVQRKTTSEIEEVEAPSNCSPLHRLMGYASPSKVIRGG